MVCYNELGGLMPYTKPYRVMHVGVHIVSIHRDEPGETYWTGDGAEFDTERELDDYIEANNLELSDERI